MPTNPGNPTFVSATPPAVSLSLGGSCGAGNCTGWFTQCSKFKRRGSTQEQRRGRWCEKAWKAIKNALEEDLIAEVYEITRWQCGWQVPPPRGRRGRGHKTRMTTRRRENDEDFLKHSCGPALDHDAGGAKHSAWGQKFHDRSWWF